MAHRPARSRFDTGVSLRIGLGAATTRRAAKVLGSTVEQRIAAMRPPPIKIAIASPGRAGLAVRAASRVLGTGRGQQLQAVIRQQVGRIPVPARVAALGGAVFGIERGIEATTGRSPAKIVFDLTRGRGRDVFDTGKQPSRQVRSPNVAGNGSMQHVLINQWQTFPGGPVFSRFADGHIEVTRKNGTVKHYRPYRPVVIPKKWDARAMRRVATALKRQRKTATKILQLTGGVPKRQERAPSRAHRSVDV